MRSKKETGMRQIACQKCKKIFEKRKYITPQPKYCTRVCYAQALKAPTQIPKEEQVNTTPQECTLPIKFFFLSMLFGLLTMAIVAFIFITITDYVWSF